MEEYKLTYWDRFKKEKYVFGAAVVIFGIICWYGWTSDDLFDQNLLKWILRLAPILILGGWQVYNYFDVIKITKWMNRYNKTGEREGDNG